MIAPSHKPRRRRRIALDANVLADLLMRIVPVARPERIILFGSAARGEMGPNSDVDLLVVKAGKYRRRRVTAAIYRSLHGAPVAVDVVVVTPEEVKRYRDTPCLVICPALKEGRVVYGAQASAAGQSP